MTKREILIKKLVEKNIKMLNRLSDETLIFLAGDTLQCNECPLYPFQCDKYLHSTCEESIKAWYKEGEENANT